MISKEELESQFLKHGFEDFKWIDPENIVVSHWVRMKCMYGCPNFGYAACPPHNPPVSECKSWIKEYKNVTIFHFTKKFDHPEDRHAWIKEINAKLLKLERDIFLSGYVKAFLLSMGSCELCHDCTKERKNCKHPKLARPTPEGMAIDVFTTVRQAGYPINVLKDYSDEMNRYAFLMIE